ncbi:MAG: GH1 family beta-glucosidase [Kosmotogaceae bacterium]
MLKDNFPKDFFWGTATASYQIEGADLEDGKGPSIWTEFSHKPGKIETGENGDVACDHYHRYEEDVELMKELDVNAYRLSLSWPRIFPEGRGKANQKGIAFYDRLFDELLSKNITPFITLYHWDLPLKLQEDIKGWESRDIVNYFADYAAFVFEKFGDRVKYWITLNEPFCASHTSYFFGEHAPGLNDPKKSFQVAHHLLLAHGESVKRFRKIVKDGKVGLTNVSTWIEKADESVPDEAISLANQFTNDWFYLPPAKGKYPEEFWNLLVSNKLEPVVKPGDMEIISNPVDFWGVNYYTRQRIERNPDAFFGYDVAEPILETTEMGWEIYPQGLTKFLEMAYRRYNNKPIYVTENGMADKDVLVEGRIHDNRRIDYIKKHINAILDAIKGGGDIRGYFLWTLMDNFEWAKGYSKRFGLIYVDYKNEQKRLPKDSFYYFRDFLKGKI